MVVTIRYGADQSIDKTLNRGTTVGDVLNDRAIQSVLGFGSNVQAVVDGSIQGNDVPLSDGDVMTIETKANSKAL